MDSNPVKPEGGDGTRKKRRKPPTDPDVGLVVGLHKFKVESKETRLEIVARLNADKAKLDHDLRKDFTLFLAVTVIVAVATVACLFLVLSNRYPPTIQNSAMGLLAVIVSAGVGYATGKSSR